MPPSNFRRTSPALRLILATALALAGCSGSGSGGGSVEPPPPPPPPPVDPARFQVALGGAGTELPSFVSATARGGALIVAITDSFGADGVDVWLVETDDVGTILRDRLLGGPGDDRPTGFDVTPDGGLVVGIAHEAGREPEAEVVRLDSDWNERWRVPSFPAAVDVLSDGDVAIAGPTTDPVENGDAIVVRLDPEGHQRWRTVLDGGFVENARAVTEGLDGDLYVSGILQSSPASTYAYGNVFVARVGSDGAIRWSEDLPLVGPASAESAGAALVRADGSLVLAGTATYLQGRDYATWPLWIVIDADGNVLQHEYLYETNAGGFVQMRPVGPDFDLLSGTSIVRLDADGTLLRTFPLSGTLRWFDHAPDGGFWLASDTSELGRGGQDVLLSKLDAEGVTGPPPARAAIPAATTFGARETIADTGPALATMFAKAATAPMSGALLTWWWDSDGSGSQPIEAARRDSKGHWTTTTVAPAGQGGGLQALVPIDSQRAVAIWVGSPEVSLYASDLDPRQGWAARTRLDPDVGTGYLLDLATDSAGHAEVIWGQSAFGINALGVRRFDAAARAWAAPQVIPGTIDSDSRGGRLTFDEGGRVRAIWTSTFELGGAHDEPDGTWRNDGPFVVEPHPIYSLGPAPAWKGYALATWTVYHEQTAALRVLWLRDGLPIGAPRDLAEVPILDATSFTATIDGDGHALVVWLDHLTLVAAESEAGGAFSAPARHPDEAAQGAYLVAASSLGAGELLVSFVEGRDGRSTVWGTRYHLGRGWGSAEYLGDGDVVSQAGPTVAWRAPNGETSTLVARTAR